MTPHRHPLDNPTWHALTGPHAAFAEGTASARRYRPDVSVFGGFDEPTPEAWRSLAEMIGPDFEIVLNRRDAIEPPPGWRLMGACPGHQMVLDGDPAPTAEHDIVPLGEEHVDAMRALVALTEPGPFRPRTIELGGYVGVFDGDRLVAMAGRRLGLADHVEISAVCTHPDARRRGLAASVTAAVARGIQAEGRTPILHVAKHNPSAKRVYDQLGFVERTLITFSFLRAPSSGA